MASDDVEQEDAINSGRHCGGISRKGSLTYEHLAKPVRQDEDEEKGQDTHLPERSIKGSPVT